LGRFHLFAYLHDLSRFVAAVDCPVNPKPYAFFQALTDSPEPPFRAYFPTITALKHVAVGVIVSRLQVSHHGEFVGPLLLFTS